jgi:hypothetical protein
VGVGSGVEWVDEVVSCRRRRCSLSSLLSHEATAADTTHSEGENQEKRLTWTGRSGISHIHTVVLAERERDGRAEEQSERAIRGASGVH